MRHFPSPRQNSAFTLIELLVVIAVIAILSIVVVLVLNPAELLRQSRDSNRLSDMASINSALGIYFAEGGAPFGTANTVYVSIPDPTATSTAGDQCQGLGLPALPAIYSYHCAASSTYRAANGTGWIPINFLSLSGGSPIATLPQDPINASSSCLYYTYTTNGTQYEVTSAMESQKYGFGGSKDVISTDGGPLATVYEKGSQFGLEPLDYGDPTLVGYWPLNEGTGTVAYDYSGNNATGSWQGTPSGSNGYYNRGGPQNASYAGYFNGSAYVYYPGSASFFPPSAITVSIWIQTTSTLNGAWVNANGVYEMSIKSTNLWWYLTTTGGNPVVIISGSKVFDGKWHYVVGTYDTTTGVAVVYVDGVQAGQNTGNTGGIATTTSAAAIGAYNGGGGPGSSVVGNMYDVRIYNRALSATQIAAMYNGGK